MARPLPEALRKRSDREAIFEDIAPYRGTTVDQRSRILSDLCRFAAEQVAAHPAGQRILAFQEPLSPSSAKLWRDLVTRARAKR